LVREAEIAAPTRIVRRRHGSGVRSLPLGSGSNSTPRIRDLKDRKLCTIERPGTYPLLEPLIGEAIDPAVITGQRRELMRLKLSIEAGAVPASA
jgi:TnpA family transposase